MNIKNEIVKMLKNNGRLSDLEMSSMLNIGEEEVMKARAELEEKNIILKYSAIVDKEFFDNGNSVHAFIEVKVTPERDKGFNKMADRLRQFPEVQSVYLLSGTYDLLVMVEGHSLKDIAFFVSDKLSPLGMVLSTSTHFLLKTYKEDGVIMQGDEEMSSRLSVAF